MQVAPPGGQIYNLCKWRHLMAEFTTDASCANWWPKLSLKQVPVAKFINNKVTPFTDSWHVSVVPLALFITLMFKETTSGGKLSWLEGNTQLTNNCKTYEFLTPYSSEIFGLPQAILPMLEPSQILVPIWGERALLRTTMTCKYIPSAIRFLHLLLYRRSFPKAIFLIFCWS